VFCRRAYLLLTEKPLGEGAPARTGNAELDDALENFPAAYDAVKRRSYGDSVRTLDLVSESLKKARK
ncbi:MAG: hypothetical protein ACRD3W_04750, partial [Terriglobales bacterium]